MTRHHVLAALVPLVLLSACAGPRLEVAAAPAQPSVTLGEAGIRLTILPHAWTGYPSDLPRYYTPVQILIENVRPDAIQIRYQDFVALDDAHNQYRAVPPGEVAHALYGSRELVEPRFYASSDPFWYPFPYGHPYDFFSSPFSPYPFFPDYPFGFYRSRAYDILTLGLREGPVLPGAHVSGFLFLQLATRTAHALSLIWTPLEASGKPIATFRTELRVVR